MIRWAVGRPVAVLMLFAALVLTGALALKRLPVDLLPAINYPNLTVITGYADTPADDLTRLVTEPLEEVIAGLAGVRRVVSRTREGFSTITVQYEWGTDMDFANLHLREAIDRVAYREDFPAEADRPLILRWDPGARPIAILVLEGEGPLEQMTAFARDVAKPALEQIQGVSQAEVIGGSEREILVRPDFEKLRLYGLSVADLSAALQIANVSFPGGRIRRGPLHLPLRILGEFENLDEIRATEIPNAPAGLAIADIAEVLDTVKEAEGATLLGDHEVVSLHLYKEPGANTIAATEEVDRVLQIVAGQYPDFAYRFVYRDADFVASSFNGLLTSLFYGALLALILLAFFLHDWKSPLVIGLAIPISMFTTFTFLKLAGVNINLMSLAGLSLVDGMLVDSSIVVLENITRHLREDEHKTRVTEIAVRATREVAAPVVVAILTTVAVFFPVIYVPGIAGEFFRDQALTVTIALLISILSALYLQPTLCARLLAGGWREPRGIFRICRNIMESIAEGYHRLLVSILDHKIRLLIPVAVGLGVALLLGLKIEKAFLPERNRGDFTAALELPAGTPLEETKAIAGRVSNALEGMNEVETVYAQVGRTEKTLAALKEYTAANTARIRVVLKPSRDGLRRMQHVQGRLATQLEQLAGTTYVLEEEGIGLREILASGEAAFTLGIVAEKADVALQVAEELLPRLRQVPGLSGVTMDRVLGNPTVELAIDREEVLRYGFEPEQVAQELRGRIQGVVATTYNEIEQRIDIAVRLREDERQNLPAVLASPISLRSGGDIPLARFVKISEGRPVREIVRRNQRRQISLMADVQGRNLEDVWKDVRRLLAGTELPAGASFVIGGEQEEINSSFRNLGWALLLSVALVYMILTAQFESFWDPLIISAVVPVGVMGAVMTLFLAGQSLNIISLIGLIVLVGISVNDAIVKVDAIRRLRREGLAGRAAILEASRERFRAILITTSTTVLAMIPMSIGVGTGEQIQRPLAITIMGGLSLATLLTFFVTPSVYEIVHRRIDRDYERGRAPEASHAGAGASSTAGARQGGAE